MTGTVPYAIIRYREIRTEIRLAQAKADAMKTVLRQVKHAVAVGDTYFVEKKSQNHKVRSTPAAVKAIRLKTESARTFEGKEQECH